MAGYTHRQSHLNKQLAGCSGEKKFAEKLTRVRDNGLLQRFHVSKRFQGRDKDAALVAGEVKLLTIASPTPPKPE